MRSRATRRRGRAGWRSGRPFFGGTPTGAVAIPLAGALHLPQPWSSGRLAVSEAAAVDPAPVTAWPRRQIALDLGPGRALRGPKDRARDERQEPDSAGVRPVMAQPLRPVGIDRSRWAKALFHRVRAVSWAGFENQCLCCARRSHRPWERRSSSRTAAPSSPTRGPGMSERTPVRRPIDRRPSLSNSSLIQGICRVRSSHAGTPAGPSVSGARSSPARKETPKLRFQTRGTSNPRPR